jgi:dTDP-4-amino-4,6-dideoxygalactose transaminase
VTTNDPGIAATVRLLRDHGQQDKYTHAVVGYCDRLHNLQAAFLGVKLPGLADANAARRRTAALYDRLLSKVEGVGLVTARDDVQPVHHLYVVEVDGRDDVRASLERAGVASGIHYPVPLHLTPAYAHLGYGAGDFPVAEQRAGRILSLPMHPYMTEDQTSYVVQSLEAALQ